MIPRQPLADLLAALAGFLPGGILPEAYAAIDTETSGLNVKIDRPVSIGLAMYEQRRPVWVSSRVLFRPALRLSRRAVEIHGIDSEAMAAKGEDPEVVYRHFMLAMESVPVILGYNAFNFDLPVLQQDVAHYLNSAAADKLAAIPLIDVGLTLKAAGSGGRPRGVRTLSDFWAAISKRKATARWSLDWAMATLKLGERADRHDAGDDARFTGTVWETLREVADA